MNKRVKIANLKMKHAFRHLNGSDSGHPKHPPQNHLDWRQRNLFASRKRAELKRAGFNWQVARIDNYNHRLRKEWKNEPYMMK